MRLPNCNIRENLKETIDKVEIPELLFSFVFFQIMSRSGCTPCVRCFSGRGMEKSGGGGGLISWLKQAPRPLQMPHLNKWVLLINKSSTLCEENWGYTILRDKCTQRHSHSLEKCGTAKSETSYFYYFKVPQDKARSCSYDIKLCLYR